MSYFSSPRQLITIVFILTVCTAGISCSDSKPENDDPETTAAKTVPSNSGRASAVKPENKFDRDKLYALMKNAKKTFKTGDFRAAAKKYNDAVTIAKIRPRLEKDKLERAARMIKRCDVFTALLTDVSPPIFSDRKRIYRFTMISGRNFIAKVLWRDGGRIKILKENGTGGVLEEDDIVEENRLDEKDYNKYLLDTLRKDEAEAKKQKNYFTLYNCVYFAAQHKLLGEISRLLEETFSLSGSEDLINIFRPDDYIELTTDLLESYDRKKELLQFKLARGLVQVEKPGKAGPVPKPTVETPEPVAMVTPPPPEKTGDVEDADRIKRHGKVEKPDSRSDIAAGKKARPGTGPLAGEPTFAKAQKLLNLARIEYRNSMPGRPDAVACAKRAQEILEKALDLVNPLLDKYPGNFEVDQLGTQISYLLYAIIKNRGFN